MKKPKVYVHRLEDWYSLYMDANNEKLLRSFCDVVTESDRMEPMSEEELVDRMKDCEAILSLNGIGMLLQYVALFHCMVLFYKRMRLRLK